MLINRSVLVGIVILIALFGIGYILSVDKDNEVQSENELGEFILEENMQVILKTSLGDLTVELFTEDMPITTGNFLKLVGEGFYDGIKFHRVIPNFMIQVGDPLTKDESLKPLWGTGGPGYTIEDEFIAGEHLSNVRGTLSMANTGLPNSGGSQLFINVADNLALDFDKEPLTSKHPVFGRVIDGMDVVDAIVSVPTEGPDRPVNDVVIKEIILEQN